MNIIGMTGSERSGIFNALHEESASAQRAGLLSAYAGGTREKAPMRPAGASDSVFISETAMLLASGLLAPNAPVSVGDEPASPLSDGRGSAGPYSPVGYETFARARITARLARTEAASASMALLAPLPPGGDDPDGSNQALNGTDPASSSDAAFAVAKLRDRLRELQQELTLLESGDTPDRNKISQAHSLTSRINQTMRDISGLLHRTQL